VPALEPGFVHLFDGTEATFNAWVFAGQGKPGEQAAFALVDGTIVAQPGGPIALLYYGNRQFGNFTLRLQFRLPRPAGDGNDNSGIFIRSRDPRRAVPDPQHPGQTLSFGNQAEVAVVTGFEVQIDEEARGNKTLNPPEQDGLDMNRTGAIYKVPIGGGAGQQQYQRGPHLQLNAWNDYEITVKGEDYTVKLNGQKTTQFRNTDNTRGRSPQQDPFSGYIGLQCHTGRVAFRNIRIKPA
jgi:hypothetical protein